jgi:hypothetical protein
VRQCAAILVLAIGSSWRSQRAQPAGAAVGSDRCTSVTGTWRKSSGAAAGIENRWLARSWGLACKPSTDAMRKVPNRVIAAELARRGAAVRAYDPVAMNEARHVLEGTPRLAFADSQQQAPEVADALVIVTEWNEFRNPDFDHIKATLKAPVIFDGRSLYEPGLMKSFGIEYAAVGRAVA